ncbi:MAG: transporter [Sediminicola sp.]
MKHLSRIAQSLVFFLPFCLIAQYTDVINSNRPGQSVSAYAVGRNVVQAEMGVSYERDKHSLLQTESNFLGVDLALRYGLLFETLELYWEGTYQKENISYNGLGFDAARTDFSRNRLGLKFLIYDPFKNPENNKPDLYSWRANHKFKWKNLLPAVSVYGGANFILGDNPFYPEDPTISPRAMIATQSRITPRFVLISNISYDRIGSDFPEMGYIISLTHALRNPKWSIFVENQGIKSDRYSDAILRTGTAYLFNENFQADMNIGASLKNTPSKYFGTIGFSYRLDMHQDKLVPIEDQNGGENGQIGRNSMKKSKGEDGGAELGLTKKQLKKQKKMAKRKQRKEGSYEF